jgi:hypothetical protein
MPSEIVRAVRDDRPALADTAIDADFFVRDPSAFFTGEVRDHAGDVAGITDTQRSAFLK